MTTRCFCGADFASRDALIAHIDKKGHRLRCSACRALSADEIQASNHERHAHGKDCLPSVSFKLHPAFRTSTLKASKEFSKASKVVSAHGCKKCNKQFKSVDALRAHQDDKHPGCAICQQVFVARSRLEAHQKASNHCYCHEHSLAFSSTNDFKTHMNESLHVTGFECLQCNREFKSEQAFEDHLNSDGHATVILAHARAEEERRYATAAEASNLRCEECDRGFINLSALQHHKASLKHKPLSELRCPLSKKCHQVFASPSMLLTHLESGKCEAGMNRMKLNAAIHLYDKDRQVTDIANAASVISTASEMGVLPSVSDLASSFGSFRSQARQEQASSKASSVYMVVPDEVSSDTDSIREGVSVLTPSTRSETLSAQTIVADEFSDTESIGSSGALLTQSISSHAASSLGGIVLTPTSSNQVTSEWSFIHGCTPLTPATTSVTNTSVNTVTYDKSIRAWPCIVPSCPRTFRKREHLLQHVNSVAHAPELFHCPTIAGVPDTGPPRKFKTLSGLAQHIEAGACIGGREALSHIAALFEEKIATATGKRMRLLKPVAGDRAAL